MQTQVTLPADQAAQLQREAVEMGLDLPAYLAFLRESHQRKHDAAFGEAARFAFSRYPKTLKKLVTSARLSPQRLPSCG